MSRPYLCSPSMWGVKDSNEAEVLAILEALHVYSGSFLKEFRMKNDSLNAISWVNSMQASPCEFQFYFNKIKFLSLASQVVFCHVNQSANGMANAMAKQGLDRVVPLEAYLL